MIKGDNTCIMIGFLSFSYVFTPFITLITNTYIFSHVCELRKERRRKIGASSCSSPAASLTNKIHIKCVFIFLLLAQQSFEISHCIINGLVYFFIILMQFYRVSCSVFTETCLVAWRNKEKIFVWNKILTTCMQFYSCDCLKREP